MNNRLHAEIPPDALENVHQKINSLKTDLPFLIKLSEPERKSLALLDDGRRPFVEKCFELGARNPMIDPGPGLIDAAKNDLSLFIQLSNIKFELEQVLEMVRDTKQLAGAEAYETARFIYMKSQMAVKMKLAGSQSFVDELGKLFKQTSAAPKQKTT
jgi:hypothetical protein